METSSEVLAPKPNKALGRCRECAAEFLFSGEVGRTFEGRGSPHSRMGPLTPVTDACQETCLYEPFTKSTEEPLFLTGSTPHLNLIQAGEREHGLIDCFDRAAATLLGLCDQNVGLRFEVW